MVRVDSFIQFFHPILKANLEQAPSKKAGKKVVPVKKTTGARRDNKVAKVRNPLSLNKDIVSMACTCRQTGRKVSRRNKSVSLT